MKYVIYENDSYDWFIAAVRRDPGRAPEVLCEGRDMDSMYQAILDDAKIDCNHVEIGQDDWDAVPDAGDFDD